MEPRPLLGIRHEDKSRWERRAPLTPAHVQRLVEHYGIDVAVQTSPTRIFADELYAAAGAKIVRDLRACRAILGVKEIPSEQLYEGMSYAYFAHVFKGQPQNMAMLRTLLDRRCTLVDYEKVTDDKGRRLIFFGWYAGFAGMLESLWALGQRLRARGIETPLSDVRRPYQYSGIVAAREHIRELGQRIAAEGLAPELRPLVVGVLGYGNVSRGAQDLLDQLPVTTVTPAELLAEDFGQVELGHSIVKVVFAEQHMVEPIATGSSFELQEYFQQPGRYRSAFARYLPRLSVIVNCIYWDQRYPRFVTRANVKQLFADPGRKPRTVGRPHLEVVGDISADVEGSMEVTLQHTDVDSPVFVYRPDTDDAEDGVEADGPVIMAIDYLPCELPADATQSFGDALVDFVPSLVRTDFRQPFQALDLPAELRRALIVQDGQLTPDYVHLRQFLGALP